MTRRITTSKHPDLLICGERGRLTKASRARSAGRLTRAGRHYWPHCQPSSAITEYDRLGQDRFLAEHGFGRATAYLLIHDGRSYDSKAIAGVAYKFATGVPLGAHEISGGIYGAARVLRRLGFEVRNVRGPAGRE